MKAGHIALLGDSIVDNSAYTRGEPDVVSHLHAILRKAWGATLCAVDGATTASLASQLGRCRATRRISWLRSEAMTRSSTSAC